MIPAYATPCTDDHCYTAWTSEARTNTMYHLVRTCTLCGRRQEEGTWES